VKQCLKTISPQYNAQRMIQEYMQMLYQPAHDAGQVMAANDFRSAREKAAWARNVAASWHKVRILESGREVEDSFVAGQGVDMRSVVDLGGLQPQDVRVEAVIGRLGVTGQLEDTEVVQLRPEGANGSAAVFARQFIPQQTGRLGFSIRISPNHFDDPLTRPCNSLIKWS
jgi:starch phosphorylase